VKGLPNHRGGGYSLCAGNKVHWDKKDDLLLGQFLIQKWKKVNIRKVQKKKIAKKSMQNKGTKKGRKAQQGGASPLLQEGLFVSKSPQNTFFGGVSRKKQTRENHQNQQPGKGAGLRGGGRNPCLACVGNRGPVGFPKGVKWGKGVIIKNPSYSRGWGGLFNKWKREKNVWNCSSGNIKRDRAGKKTIRALLKRIIV